MRIEQVKPWVEVERRTTRGWEIEQLDGLNAILRLPEIGIDLTLAELYERLTF